MQSTSVINPWQCVPLNERRRKSETPKNAELGDRYRTEGGDEITCGDQPIRLVGYSATPLALPHGRRSLYKQTHYPAVGVCPSPLGAPVAT